MESFADSAVCEGFPPQTSAMVNTTQRQANSALRGFKTILVATCGYLAEAQSTHSQAVQLQTSPLQSGHVQTSQPQALAFLVLANEQHAAAAAVDDDAHAHSPHSHESQLQFTPSQSVQRQSTQPHCALEADAP